jgi:hypothetical protein
MLPPAYCGGSFSSERISLLSLKPLFHSLHAALPNTVSHRLDIAWVSFQDTIQNWRMPAYRVRASFSEGAGKGTVLYIGDRPQYKIWTHKLFGQTVEPVLLDRFSLFQILRGRDPAFTADLTLCPLNPWTLPLFAHCGWSIMPLFVNCRADLSKPIKELFFSKGAKEDLRVVRRLGYRFDLLKDENALHEFFHEMLIPTAKLRHEERAFLSQWETIKHIYENGVLIGAYLDDKWVGGILLALEGKDTVRLANMGWRNGDDIWRKKCLVAALFNQSFIWAQERGFKWVNLGASNPFANDGPLNFKLKWGATLAAPEVKITNGEVEGAHSFIAVKFDLASLAARSFLTSTPLLEQAQGRLRAIGWNAEIPPLFQRQLDLGCDWVNLAESSGVGTSV